MAEDAGQVQAAEALLKDAALLQARDVEGCWRLLAAAAALCRRHRAWRREPFNVFTVLRSESDEVNLHSRFLAALLDHRKAPGEPRENLKDFLRTVAEHGAFAYELSDCKRIEKAKECFKKLLPKDGDFASDSIRIERESNYIDILIANDAEPKWAVAIENKIWAGDQPQQLWRYYDSLAEHGNRAMLYLTPDGHKPEEDSIYDEEREGREDRDRVPEDRLCLISYRDTLPPWLKRCQKRAYAEPSLREAIEQYLSLVRKLSGTDRTEEYMKGLKKLCVQGDNPRLIHDLAEALVSAKIDLLSGLCECIEKTLRERIPDLPLNHDLSHCSPDRIRGYVEERKNHWWFGQGYPLGGNGALLAFYMYGNEMDYGVRCDREKQEGYGEVGTILRKDSRTPPGKYDDDQWPWYVRAILPKNFNQEKLKALGWENIEFLLDEERKQKLADKIAQDLAQVWQIWKDAHKQAPSPA